MTLVSDMAEIDAEILLELGEPMIFEGRSDPIIGIFDDSAVTQVGGENTVEGRSIQFTCRNADLPGGLEEGDAVTRPLDSSTYRYLSRTDPDAAGICTVKLGAT
jgi:hypothetical protein